jgi:hypothetical protein
LKETNREIIRAPRQELRWLCDRLAMQKLSFESSVVIVAAPQLSWTICVVRSEKRARENGAGILVRR